jgi:hypothetical protein
MLIESIHKKSASQILYFLVYVIALYKFQEFRDIQVRVLDAQSSYAK